jgi:hypothetical protein
MRETKRKHERLRAARSGIEQQDMDGLVLRLARTAY